MASPETERDAFLLGQIHALKQIVGAIAVVLPEKAALLTAFDAASQHGLAFLENERLSDQAIRGFRSVGDDFRTFVETIS